MRLKWDEVGERLYETGLKRGVLYPQNTDGSYPKGVAWNGLIGVNESPSGAEPTPLWADDIKYLNMISAEEFGFSIEAYTYPDEWNECDGNKKITNDGLFAGQQTRRPFGLCYRTSIGNDTENDAHGYKLHLVYGATASPSQKGYKSNSDNPEAITLSWECKTTPVEVKGHDEIKPTAKITIDSTKFTPESMKALEDLLYGTDSEGVAKLPLPDEVATTLKPVSP